MRIEVIIAVPRKRRILPGMCASQTILPVLGVPVESKALKGLIHFLSIAQMPAGIPVGTLAIGQGRSKKRGPPGDLDPGDLTSGSAETAPLISFRARPKMC